MSPNTTLEQLCERRQRWGDQKYKVVHPKTGEIVNSGRAGLRDEWKDVAEELADALNILAHVKERSVSSSNSHVLEWFGRELQNLTAGWLLLNKDYYNMGHDSPTLQIKRIGWEE